MEKKIIILIIGVAIVRVGFFVSKNGYKLTAT